MILADMLIKYTIGKSFRRDCSFNEFTRQKWQLYITTNFGDEEERKCIHVRQEWAL